MDSKLIVEWLKEKLGEDYSPSSNPLWKEHDYVFGDTESGFSSAYTIDYEKLEAEMEQWINNTFPSPQPAPNVADTK